MTATRTRQGKMDAKWGLLHPPVGTGFAASIAHPVSAGGWDIYDINDARDQGTLHIKEMHENKIKIMCLGRDALNESAELDVWGFHDDGPPMYLGRPTFSLHGTLSAGAQYSDAQINKFVQEISSELSDGSAWFGAEDAVITLPGQYTALVTRNGLANLDQGYIEVDLGAGGFTHIGTNLLETTMAAAAVIYIPID